jgi:YegS/Rv2252/BmrU family lipid kinase
MPDDVLIFANPIAGRGRGRWIAERIAGRLAAEGFRPRLLLERPDQVRPDQLDPAARAAIAIGGDGTIRSVARQLYAQERRTGGDAPPLLIVPMGTANLLGRHLGIEWPARNLADQVVAAIRRHRVVWFDAACANGEMFLLMAGVGIDAQVVHELARIRSGPIEMLSYVLPAATTFVQYAYPSLTVTVDDQVIIRDKPAMAFVGNVKEYGTGFPLLPHARPDDGLLDVVVLPCRTPQEAVRHFLYAAAGEHLQQEGVVYAKGTAIRVTSSEPAPIQIDGEAAGHTPVDIKLMPIRVPFIVPDVDAG